MNEKNQKRSKVVVRFMAAMVMIAGMLIGVPAGALAAPGNFRVVLSESRTPAQVSVELEQAQSHLAELQEGKEEAEQRVADTQKALAEAQASLEEANGKYTQGYLGFLNWMGAKEGLTEKQVKDLNSAQRVIREAREENFSKWLGGDNTGMPEERNDKVVCIGDPNDATSINNTKKAIEILYRVNELRASDENYANATAVNPGVTNFYVMAIAESGADRGAGLMRHSHLQISCENLAFGTGDPAAAWYSEKGAFDKMKAQAGIETITSWDDIKTIESLAEEKRYTVGHYTNLFWNADQVMGAGYTPYRKTSCFNASKASNYKEYQLYTIEEFENLLNEYLGSINLEHYQEVAAVAERAVVEAAELLEQRTNAVYEAEAAVSALAEELSGLNTLGDPQEGVFTDVNEGDWYYEAVQDVYQRGLMTGMSETYFGAEESLSRAQFAAILYRRAGYPAYEYQQLFPDVPDGEWYTQCVLWTWDSKVILGYSNGSFGPADYLNREQLCTILWRYATEVDGYDNSARASLDNYPDAANISDFAVEAVQWCEATGILNAKAGRINAWENATRADCAIMISRYMEVIGR